MSLISEPHTRVGQVCLYASTSVTSHNLEHVHFKQDIDSNSITIITCAQDEIHNVHCMLEGNVM